MARHNDLLGSPLLAEHYPIFADAERVIADPIVRNRGTIGGSLCQADPSEDLSAVAAALRAEMVVRGTGGRAFIWTMTGTCRVGLLCIRRCRSGAMYADEPRELRCGVSAVTTGETLSTSRAAAAVGNTFPRSADVTDPITERLTSGPCCV